LGGHALLGDLGLAHRQREEARLADERGDERAMTGDGRAGTPEGDRVDRDDPSRRRSGPPAVRSPA